MIISKVTEKNLEEFLVSSGIDNSNAEKLKHLFWIGYRSGASELAKDVFEDLNASHMSPNRTYEMLETAIEGQDWKER